MRVGELIQKLMPCDQSAKVFCNGEEIISCEEIHWDSEAHEFAGKLLEGRIELGGTIITNEEGENG